jgi:hypothetical protein
MLIMCKDYILHNDMILHTSDYDLTQYTAPDYKQITQSSKSVCTVVKNQLHSKHKNS